MGQAPRTFMTVAASRPPAEPGAASWGSALVTGASAGIGEAFARALAARHVDLLLTALPDEAARLDTIARELTERYGVRCSIAGVDLSHRDGPDHLRATAERLGFQPDVLVNNAGVGTLGPFVTTPLDAALNIVHVNVEAVVRLSRILVEPMIARGSGAVLNVASTAALQPQPYFAVYAASKAFVLSFGEALWAECHAAGVRVVTICSGPVQRPPQNDAPTRNGTSRFVQRRLIAPDRVAECALTALASDQPLAVVRVSGLGLLYGPASCVRSVLPLRTRLRLSERVNRWLYNGRDVARPVSSADTAQSRSASAASRLSGEDETRSRSAK